MTRYSLKLTEIKSSCRLNDEQFDEIRYFWDYNYGGDITDIVSNNIRQFVKSVIKNVANIEIFNEIQEDLKGFHYKLNDISSKSFLDRYFDSWSEISSTSYNQIPVKANKISLMINRDSHLQLRLNETLLLKDNHNMYRSHYEDSKKEILKFSRLIGCAKKISSQSRDKPLSVENVTHLDGDETSLVDRTMDFFKKLVS